MNARSVLLLSVALFCLAISLSPSTQSQKSATPQNAAKGNLPAGILLEQLSNRLEEEPHLNPNTRTKEFSLRDPNGYYVTISALSAD